MSEWAEVLRDAKRARDSARQEAERRNPQAYYRAVYGPLLQMDGHGYTLDDYAGLFDTGHVTGERARIMKAIATAERRPVWMRKKSERI